MTKCVVRIGKIGRSDPDCEIRIVKKINGENWTQVERVFVQGKKKLEFDLGEGEYHVMAVGDKIAGVATTAEMDMTFPWNVHLDPPRDHSKDYKRVSIPAISDSVKDAVKKVLH
jgi:hypothetical protein